MEKKKRSLETSSYSAYALSKGNLEKNLPVNISKKDALKMSSSLKATFQIGKNGLQPTNIIEIQKALKKKKVLKIKCLRYYLENIVEGETNKEKMQFLKAFFEKTISCEVIEVKGFTLVLWQR